MLELISLLIVAIVGPVLLSILNGFQNRKAKREEAEQRRQDKLEDYKRQDEVAARVELARLALVRENKKIADEVELTNGTLKIIHTLVNSNMTAALQAQLDSEISSLVLMNELIDIKKKSGLEPSKETLAAVSKKEEKIAELRAIINDRSRQNKIAGKQIEIAKLQGLEIEIDSDMNDLTA